MTAGSPNNAALQADVGVTTGRSRHREMRHGKESRALSRKYLGNVHSPSAANLACKSQKKGAFLIQSNQHPLWIKRQDSKQPQLSM